MLKVILLEAFEDDINRPVCNFSLHFVIFEKLLCTKWVRAKQAVLWVKCGERW
jgi:hypothetical protein